MNIDYVPRAQCSAQGWNDFVDAHPRGWWWHRMEWLDYAAAYTPSATDRSVVATCDGRVVGVFPGLLTADGQLANGGQAVKEPLSVPPLGIQYGGDTGGRIEFAPGHPLPGITVRPGFVVGSRKTLVADLRPSEPELWRGVRRSYHALIHKAERNYDIGVFGAGFDATNARVVDLCHGIHAAAAGRETRSPETWACQARWLGTGNALVALATRKGIALGFVYIIRYKQWAYYASAATLAEDLNHALLWHAMKALRADGVTDYLELGAVHGETEKERNIAFFKSGFGGDEWEVQTVESRAS